VHRPQPSVQPTVFVISKTLRTWLIPRIAAAGTSFSPLPCHALYGYMFTSAHRVKVEVGAKGCASRERTPFGGAAGAPAAGAQAFSIENALRQRSIYRYLLCKKKLSTA
jgi:hypothetical protein